MSARAFAEALKLGEVPHVLNKVVSELDGEPRKTPWAFATTNPYAINLIHLNADAAEHFFSSMGPTYTQGRYNIGIWYWELPRFRDRWLSAFKFYDEVWTTSSFTAECLSEISPIPIVKVRYPLLVDTSIIQSKARKRFGLNEDAYVFLFSFDFGGVFERKNPLAVLTAFRQSFRPRDRAVLVLNHINSWFNPTAAETLRKASLGMNITILDRHLTERDYLSLLAACDCYVSLHRSEGLGLTLAEAMYLGKPVIATAYSGNMDFMNVNNSLLVKYQLVSLDKDFRPSPYIRFSPYEKDNAWAEPDVDQAAAFMRWAYENRDEAGIIGERGSRDIKQSMSPTVASLEMKGRLERIYQAFPRLPSAI